MTIAHKDLTGTDLHEIKGAGSATAGQVPVADGAGGAPFGQIGRSSLAGTANPFGAQLLHLTEEQNTGIGSLTPGSATVWNTVALNTARTAEISGAVLSANNIVLPAGTYHIEASAPITVHTSGGVLGMAQARLLNATTGQGLITGQAQGVITSLGTVETQVVVSVSGRFTLATSSVVSFQTYSSATGGFAPRPLGVSVEVYGNVRIWKVA